MKPALRSCLAAAALVAAGPAHARADDLLLAGFEHPPAEARPLVYWQWINGNVTEEGIRLDLEWMKRIGLAGAIVFDIGFGRPPIPQYVAQRVGFGTAEWRKAIRVAATNAKRLGLLLGAQSSGGWSVSGGPMVPPDQAMKKLVWSETIVTRDSPAPPRLPAPPSNNGPYQDAPIDSANHREPTRSGDVAVIAFKLPASEQPPAPRASYAGIANSERLHDGQYSQGVELAADPQGHAVLDIRLEFAPRSLTLGKSGGGALPDGIVEASVDGANYRPVLTLPPVAAQPSPVTTFSLGARRERFWRIRFRGLTSALPLTEARFEAGARLDRAPEKAGYGVLHRNVDTPALRDEPTHAIDASTIVDLTSRMAADGTLDWRPPDDDRWLVLRFGWSLTGRRTVPATQESIGFEVDKLDGQAVREFAENFYGLYRSAIGDAGRLDIAFTDSWEAGQQNWTPVMFEEFSRRRGYDLRAWLPVLTGRIVTSTARSERVLADFRRTISTLLVQNHYGELASVARRHGMQYWAQAAGTDLPTIIDGLQAKGGVDVPVGEYWYYPPGSEPKSNHVADIREATSAAHVYGRRVVAAEALTTQGEEPWALGPTQLRRLTDRFFAQGVNRVILHTSAHQPFQDRRPGMTLRQYGQHFTRNETWAEDAGAWVTYLARCSWLLQQGRPVADFLVYLGEDAATSPPFGEQGEPRRPDGFDHDYLTAHALLTRIEVRDGRLSTPGGQTWTALVIPYHVRHVGDDVRRKLQQLYRDGAVIVGDTEALGLQAFEATGSQHRHISMAAFLRETQLPMDVAVPPGHAIHWTHRSLPDADIYFLANASDRRFSDTVRFRVNGRAVEAWNAVDGSRTALSYEQTSQGTDVRVVLPPWQSIFLVFRGTASPSVDIVEPRRGLLLTLDAPWDVEFLDGHGAPKRTRLRAGESWSTNAEPAIRFYSGRARYSRTITVPGKWLDGNGRVELDLGDVAELARVRINGQGLGVLWNSPFRFDVTHALRPGRNRIEITVTNYWANRLIGDEQPGATRTTFAPIRPYDATSPLRPSGLLGPVELVSVPPGEL